MYRGGGLFGLYRGFGVSLVGIIIYRSLYFGLFETGKDLIKHYEIEKYKAL